MAHRPPGAAIVCVRVWAADLCAFCGTGERGEARGEIVVGECPAGVGAAMGPGVVMRALAMADCARARSLRSLVAWDCERVVHDDDGEGEEGEWFWRTRVGCGLQRVGLAFLSLEGTSQGRFPKNLKYESNQLHCRVA
jgi:hypothetical protein